MKEDRNNFAKDLRESAENENTDSSLTKYSSISDAHMFRIMMDASDIGYFLSDMENEMPDLKSGYSNPNRQTSPGVNYYLSLSHTIGYYRDGTFKGPSTKALESHKVDLDAFYTFSGKVAGKSKEPLSPNNINLYHEIQNHAKEKEVERLSNDKKEEDLIE